MLPKPQVMTAAELGAYMFRHHRGVGNKIPNDQIAARLGFTDLGTNGRDGLPNSKAFTDLANKALEQGIPIIYNSTGYFYALNRSDFDYLIHDCEAHVRDLIVARDAALIGRRLILFDDEDER